MNNPPLFIIAVGILCIDITLIEPLPLPLIYDSFKLDVKCSTIIGEELNATLYDMCGRVLPNFDDVQRRPGENSIINNVLKCIGIVYNIKNHYCPIHSDNKALNKFITSPIKINEICEKAKISFMSFNETGDPNFDKWMRLLIKNMSDNDSCPNFCSSREDQNVDYMCLLMIAANQKVQADSHKAISGIDKDTVSTSDNNISHNTASSVNHEIQNNNELTIIQTTPHRNSSPIETISNPPSDNVAGTVQDNSSKDKTTLIIDQTVLHPEDGIVSQSDGAVGEATVQGVKDKTSQKTAEIEDDIENNHDADTVGGDTSKQNQENQDSVKIHNDEEIPLGKDSIEELEDNEGSPLVDESSKPENSPMTSSMSDSMVEEDSNFFFYFIFMIVMTAFGYMAFHNKNKLIALMVEGRRSRSRSRSGGRHSSTSYSKLHSNLEETMTSSTAPSSTHVLY